MNIGELLSSPIVVNTVMSILGLLASWLVARILRDKVMTEQRRVAADALIAAVECEWIGFVHTTKELAADGKLTNEDRAKALREAKGFAIDIAKKQGVDLLKVIAAEEIPALIHKIIAKRKAGEL